MDDPQEMKVSDPDQMARIQRKSWERVGADHSDKEFMKPFPVPLAILGGKYDIFQDFDSEKKKIICKTLRFVAHTNGASLQFFSTKIETLVTRGRALLSHLVFNTVSSRGVTADYTKPLYIPPGSDSLKEIGPPPLDDTNLGSIHASNPIELWKSAFCSNFAQKNTKMEIKDDPAKDPQYKEEAIDFLRAQKDQELERYIRQKGHEVALSTDVEIKRPIQPQVTSPRIIPQKPTAAKAAVPSVAPSASPQPQLPKGAILKLRDTI